MSKFRKIQTAALAASMTLAVSLSAHAGSISFNGVDVPATDAQKRSVTVTDGATVNGKKYPVTYNVIMRSGDKPSADSEPFGQIFDKVGSDIVKADGSQFISNDNDFSSLLTGKDGKMYMVSHFESVPAAMYITKLAQDKKGNLKALDTHHIDFSKVEGGWVHCAGSVTPWGTHLGSEEYEPNAKAVDPVTGNFKDEYDNKMALYYGLTPDSTEPGYFSILNPYNYGWQTEIAVSNFDSVSVNKHYAMGRVAHELGYVMPDKKTVYISDDGTNVGMFRFVADNAGDLSSGELFAAKWNQTSADNGGTAVITWVSLGHATDAEIKPLLKNHVKFTDIFDEVELKDGATCPADYKQINTTWGLECLRLKPGMELAASRLESRRYAAIMGATTEFRKMEGLTFNPDTMTLYMSISEIGKGMEDNDKKADKGGNNDIRVARNTCGAVYAIQLDTHYRAVTMAVEIAGRPLSADYGSDENRTYYAAGPYANNKCDLDGIANPDNITFMRGYDTLMIGEDSGDGHENDMVWAYNVKTKKLTRVLATPYGSETTSLYFYPDYHGHGYLMTVVQHPYGEPTVNMPQPMTNSDKRAYTGYIGPFPSMSK